MHTGEAETKLRQGLQEIYGEGESGAMVSLIMEHLTGNKWPYRPFENELLFNKEQEQRLKDILQRLQHQEPLQYILGEAWFYNMKLFVTPDVLIPRSETEELVLWVIQDVEQLGLNVFERQHAEADVTTQLKMLDIGTGSGCIALALKKQMPKAEVWGCDISEGALNIARRNGAELDVRVDFQGIDILDEAQQRFLPTVDIIVSNPPYIPVLEKDSMPRNVVQHEPHVALFVPNNDALCFYRAIAQFGKKRLYDKGAIYLEIHENLGKDVITLFQLEGYETIMKKDMQGKDRMVKAWKSLL
ncbi:MAG TPA: peptide chain release factor N(5)-glutamine methyltransferase [Flavisolibacter sp.]|nr:peptide chain release factor N(5)-glutamine methyltransferase [Flavisolibacter sp.]